MKKLLVLDNYDSFTFNLVHLIEKLSNYRVDVRLNDKIDLEEVEQYQKVILSPGPGLPSQAGIMPQLISEFAPSKSILGVCLGMQGIAENFGAKLKNLPNVFHGLATPIHVLKDTPLFKNCPNTFNVGRYHSWVMDEKKSSPDLDIIAEDDLGLVMAIQHKRYNVCGVQFHPESILSEHGETILQNWLHG